MAYRRREGDYRFRFRIKSCDGDFVQHGCDLQPMRDWLKEHVTGNYRTVPLGKRSYLGVKAFVFLDCLTDATAFKLRWSEDIQGQSDKGYSYFR